MRRERLPPPNATREEIDSFFSLLKEERRVRRESGDKVYTIRTDGPAGPLEPVRVAWKDACRMAKFERKMDRWARVVYVRPKPPPPPKVTETRVRTRFGQVGLLRERRRQDGCRDVEFIPGPGLPHVTFVGAVWSHGAEEDAILMPLSDNYEVPPHRERWATWISSDGALFTYERLTGQPG